VPYDRPHRTTDHTAPLTALHAGRPPGTDKEDVMETGLIALAAGLAVGLAAIATGMAQARIGAAAMGAMAEKPELAGRAILLVAIPETLVILGFAVAAMIILLLGG
jgi:V/A-type H+-transporting ATPase subunit K